MTDKEGDEGVRQEKVPAIPSKWFRLLLHVTENSQTSVLRNSPLRKYLIAFFAASCLCWCCSIAFSHLPWAGNAPESGGWQPLHRVYIPVDRLMFEQRLDHFHTSEFSSPALGMPFVYPPLSGVLLEGLHLTGDHARLSFFLSIGIILCAAGFAFGISLRRRGLTAAASIAIVLAACALSYPLSVEYARENIEIYLWALLMAAAWAIWKDRPGYAALFIGAAIALKYYPVVMLLLFARRDRWRFAFAACGVAACLHVVSLWAVGGPHLFETQKALTKSFAAQREMYMLTRSGSGMEHSLFGTLKQPLLLWNRFVPATRLLLTAYVPIVGALVLLLWQRVRRLPLPNQLIAVFVWMVLLPPTSFDYTLMHLYAVWGILLLVAVYPANPQQRKMLWVSFALLGVCTSPQDFLYIRSLDSLALGGPLKCCALLALLYLVSKIPLPDPRIGSLTVAV